MTLALLAAVLLMSAALWAQQPILATWDEALPGDIVDGYVLQAGTAPGLTEVWWDVGPVTATSVLLWPGSWFLRLIAYNVHGQSPPSNEATVTIEEDPEPVDCVMSPWVVNRVGDWIIPCQPTPSTTDPVDAGRLTRQEILIRTIVTPPENGGMACGATMKKRTGVLKCVYEPPAAICLAEPLTVTVTTWAEALVYTASQPIESAIALYNADRKISHAAFTDIRGCWLTKPRF